MPGRAKYALLTGRVRCGPNRLPFPGWPVWLLAVVIACRAASAQAPGAFASAENVVLDEQVLEHEPIETFPADTPIPIYAEILDLSVRSLELHYRVRARFKTVPMRPEGDGYAARIPCSAVMGATTVEYYIEAQDSEGAVIGESGSRDSPHRIRLVESGSTEAAHLPGKPPPQRCSGAEAGGRETGTEEPDDGASSPREPRVWLGALLLQDAQLATGTDICSRERQKSSGYACFREGEEESQYLGTPLPGAGGKGSGLQLATTRIAASFDVAVLDALTLGTRLGYVLRGGGPKPASSRRFLPLHAEGRLAYWFTGKAYGEVSGFAFVAGGVGQIDSKTEVTVQEDPNAPPPTAQLDNPPTQKLEAWKKSGVGFGALGAGAFFALGRTHGIEIEGRVSYLFPTTGVAFSIGLGYVFGL